MTDSMVERAARAIARRHGDDFDAIPADKPDWTANRGQFAGRFRDVNEPYQSDYLDMAEAAIEAMASPTADMLLAATRMENRPDEGLVEVAYSVVALDIWPKMITAALRVQP